MAEPTDLMVPGESHRLSLAQFARLANVPPEAQWFANLANFNPPTGLT